MIFETGQVDALMNASWVGWTSVVYLGLIMTVVGYGIWFTVLSRNPVSHVMPVLLVLPVFTVLFSVILLGERPSLEVLLGGVTILAGVSLIVFSKSNTRST